MVEENTLVQPVEPESPAVEEEVEEVETKEEEVKEPSLPKPVQKPRGSGTVPEARFNEVWGQMRRFERLASQLLEERKELVAQKEPALEEKPVDFDNMTPKQLVEYVESRAEKRAQEILESTIGPMQERNKAKEVRESILQASAKYPDYDQYIQDMIPIANAHPTLNAEEVYLLASGQKGAAGDKILTRLKDKVAQKRNALTEHRSSPASRQGKIQKFSSVREGALAAAKELGFDVE